MKKSLLKLIATAATFTLLSTSLQTQAKEGDVFVGAMVNHAMYESDSIDEFGISAFTFRLNYELSENQMIETRVSSSLGEQTVNNIDYELNKLFGIYYSYNYEITKSIAVYGLVGFSSVDLNKTINDVVYQEDELLPSFGAGFTFKLAKDVNFNIDGMLYSDDDDYKYAAAGAGIELFF